MLENKRVNKSGSAFIIVIGILAIIIFVATMFMSSTIQEGKETAMSTRGLHATSLAEAAVERAMALIMKKINDIDLDKTKADDLSIKIRLPAPEGSSNLGLGANLGKDNELTLADDVKKEIEFNKDNLQEEDNNKSLDELVKYMTNNGAKEYEVTVKAKITHAFRNSPGVEKPDYKIPGVDIQWNARRDVNSVLDGHGYTAWHFEFPKEFTWFDFQIPIEVLGIEIASIDMVAIVSKLLEPIVNDPTLKEMTTIDWLAGKIMNDIIGNIAKKITGDDDMEDLYPINIKIGKGNIPTSISDLWPSGTSISEQDNQYLEKYGQISFDSEAKITYKDGYTASRRINAVKDFKVSDCEPPAPMYSLFIANEDNEQLALNNYGGQFYVNNLSYTNMLSRVRKILAGKLSSDDKKDLNKREFPGLIRINGKNNEPIYCNIGFLGDTSADIKNKSNSGQVINESSGFLGNFADNARDIVNGVEAVLMLKSKDQVNPFNKSYSATVEVKEKQPESEKDSRKYTASFSTSSDLNLGNPKDVVSGLMSTNIGTNIIPKVGNMNTSVVRLAICLAVMPFAESAVNALGETVDKAEEKSGLSDYVSINDGTDVMKELVKKLDCFETWEMPYMGTANELYTLPNLGQGSNKTHLFGYSGMHPTMTKEIEGNVLSQYRQWRMCIVGMYETDKIWIGPVPIPPIPIPIWKSTTQNYKYGYNLEHFKSLSDDSGRADDDTVHIYDPALPENMVPNLYTCEQYAKKATYYYEDQEKFLEDLPNRVTTIDGKEALVLNGITYIAGSLGSGDAHFSLANVDGLKNKSDTLYVVGKGMIVVSGNTFLGCNIVCLDKSDEEKTTFSLICRNGGLVILNSGNYVFEGALYTNEGLYIGGSSSLHILGNWSTNKFKKALMSGTVVLDYVSSRTRSSVGSLHPARGKYDPKRYHVSFSPIWETWRAY